MNLEKDKGQKGLMAGQLAKQRLREKQLAEEAEYERSVDQMVLDTSK
jgi:hypothetical protein